MKKMLLFQAIIIALCPALSAQVRTMRLNSPTTAQRPTNGAVSNHPSQTQVRNIDNAHLYARGVPRPDPIRFMTWRTKLLREPGMHASNVMDLTRPAPSGGRGTPATTRMSSQMNAHAIEMQPVVTHQTPDGKRVSYTLTTNTGEWENKPNYNARVAARSQPSGDGQWNCSTSTISINATSTSFLNPSPDLQGSMLLPGMIYTFDDYSRGNFNQQYNAGRNPINLVSSVLNSNTPVSVTVNDPGLSSLSEGIRSIVSSYLPSQAGSDYQVQATLTDNNSDQNIFVSAGGSYGAFEGSASFRHQQNDHHIYYTIDAIKPMFTINAQPAGNGLYPGSAPTPNSPLLMLQSVTFGARVLANMDIELSSSSNLGNLHLSYNDGMESARTDMEALFANQSVKVTINGYLIGFPTQFSGSFVATKDNFFHLMDQFFSGCNYTTAKPIQYRMVNMNGDQVGIYSATDNFNIQECTPADETFTLQSVMAVIQSGDDAKNDNSEFWLSVGAGDPAHIRWAGQIYDNHSEFKRDGNPYQIPIPVAANAFTDQDFKNGGLVALKLLEHGHSGDDWNFQDLKLIFNFVSQKGTPLQKTLDISNFTLHDTKNAQQDSKDIFFQPGGDANTLIPVQ